MAVTIRDVAKAAGVSATTVSRVFNHSDLVTKQTQERVQAVANRMGYRPNATAKSLSHGRTQTIGIIVPAPHGEFFSEIIRAADEVAQQSEHYLLISSAHYSLEESEVALQSLQGRVDGLLVMTTHVQAQAELLDRYAIDIPVVFMNSPVEASPYPSFQIENRGGAQAATQHLIDRGYRHIGIILGPRDSHDVQERVAGYRAALAAAGRDPDAQPVIEGDFTQASGFDAGRQLLALDTLPDAVFACNDYMAIGAMAALQKEGIVIPDDLAIVGFDDIPSAQYTTPSLTTVRVPVYELGRRAAERLIAMLGASVAEAPLHTTMPSELVVRTST
ncbi:LacI family DNA-binding transcriptional regulator [Salisaeta longa]|uniref:LacI family DNA-binding transcriptional regulator n=1 Tax=Salisaeta longa TaxID=503170 RepID=UPI0003B6CAD4|nr:LacI family DNA-binding transcriptional regulator [Salisaeta longa]